MLHRRFALILALAMVLAACTVTGSGTTTTTTSATVTTTREGPDPTEPETTTTRPEDAGPLPGTEGLPQGLQTELMELVGVTEELRGLEFMERPLISVVTEDELEARVRSLIQEDAADFPADEDLYQLLGLLEEDAVLETLLTDLYGEQVAGFYDGDTGEMVVPMREEGLRVVERGTLIHELSHALTDQHFGFDDVMERLVDEDRLDQASAYQALVEGDASLVELLYLQTLSQRELGEFFADALDIDQEALQAAPEFIQDSLIFPYDSGLAFVQELYRSNGWEAVNSAYATLPDLPGSTEQVITPSDYQRDLPIDVAIEAVALDGYEIERTSVWGELGFRIMLDQILGEESSLTAADGWGGDAYAQWHDGENAALLLVYEGDTADDLAELNDALVSYATTAVAEEDFVWIEEINGQLVFIVADVPEVGETILDSVRAS